MANNLPICLLARLLDFSLNSLACLAWKPGFTNSSCIELALRPGHLRHPESPGVAITQNYSYNIDARSNGKMISTLLRVNSCNLLLLDDDRFPFLSLSRSLPFALLSLLWFCQFDVAFLSLLAFGLFFPTLTSNFSLFLPSLYCYFLPLFTHIHTHTHTVHTQLHTREPDSENTSPRIMAKEFY